MKKFFLLSIAIIIISCGKESQAVSMSDESQIAKDSIERIIDSLKDNIQNLTSTEYDLVVKALKSLPEHENSLFLTPKENEEYLKIVSQNANRFKNKIRYFDRSNDDWIILNDTVKRRASFSLNCKILFDTTQTLKPILEIEGVSEIEYKKKKEKDSSFIDYSTTQYKYYYIPKLKIGYIVVPYQRWGEDGLESRYLKDYDLLDKALKNNFYQRK